MEKMDPHAIDQVPQANEAVSAYRDVLLAWGYPRWLAMIVAQRTLQPVTKMVRSQSGPPCRAHMGADKPFRRSTA
jgi:hypothetical protein